MNKKLWELEEKLRRDLAIAMGNVVWGYMGKMPYHLIIHALDAEVEKLKERIRREARWE